jgi:thiosulfate/3-mercaptopyruvate sulfurtransferase
LSETTLAVKAQEDDQCLGCHTDPQKLQNSTSEPAEGDASGQADAWKKVLVDKSFPSSIHGLNGCISCHKGLNVADKNAAHEGIIPNPSRDPEALCGQCHPDVVSYASHNLHATVKGYETVLAMSGVPTNHPAVQSVLNGECSSCHATCGECHVSQPSIVGGGFVNGHNFNRTPPMLSNCMACHGSRLGVEFLGQNGTPSDIHYQQGQMVCTDCHSVTEVHGQPDNCIACHPGPKDSQLSQPEHRYSGPQSPRCESCHPNVAAAEDDVLMHKMHGGKLACQVCHAVAYPNWEGIQPVPGDTSQDSPASNAAMVFLIGRNPLPSYERPYEYVLVRRLPLDKNTFGPDLTLDMNKLETWTYATPHNIQLHTPQTKSCNACHGNSQWFLTADKVTPDEQEGNRWVIVNNVPPEISSGDQIPDR